MEAIRINGYGDLETDKICYYPTQYGWKFYHPKVGLGSLEEHEVVEHKDGTITVSPSILMMVTKRGKKVQIHGYLKRGKWEDC